MEDAYMVSILVREYTGEEAVIEKKPVGKTSAYIAMNIIRRCSEIYNHQ